MFVDIKRSTEFLREHEQAMMFSEENLESGKGEKMDVEA